MSGAPIAAMAAPTKAGRDVPVGAATAANPGEARRYAPPRDDAPLIVFDFDHTLYDGDSGSHLFAWLIKRTWWRRLLALLLAPVFGPMVAFLPTRRMGISGFVWAGTVGFHRVPELDALIDAYVANHVEDIRGRLLPVALEVFHAHRERGDRVVVATGAPPELARAILSFVAHEDVPVVGTLAGPRFGAVVAARHCHNEEKMRMLRELGWGDIDAAYSDSWADLPLLLGARRPVVVNPKQGSIERFRRALPPGTPILNWGCPGRGGEPVAVGVGADGTLPADRA
ncbi:MULTISPECIES: haloacid dehalogenase-like hydrolase [unclassified Luteimonas]